MYENNPYKCIDNFVKCMRNHGFKNVVHGNFGDWSHENLERINEKTNWNDEIVDYSAFVSLNMSTILRV